MSRRERLKIKCCIKKTTGEKKMNKRLYEGLGVASSGHMGFKIDS